jgi:hypothetical protein
MTQAIEEEWSLWLATGEMGIPPYPLLYSPAGLFRENPYNGKVA